MDALNRKVKVFRAQDGRRPFLDWLNSLRDRRAKQKIQVRLDRLSLGNLGDHRSVGEGVTELRLDYGPGYRIYVGQDGSSIVILLVGGDKSSQDGDIKTAKGFWKEYQAEKSRGSR